MMAGFTVCTGSRITAGFLEAFTIRKQVGETACATPTAIITSGKGARIIMSQPTSRRFFLGAATAAGATRVWGANDRISVAIVGLGGRGSNHLSVYSRLPEAHVVGLCDVHQAARERARGTRLKNTG